VAVVAVADTVAVAVERQAGVMVARSGGQGRSRRRRRRRRADTVDRIGLPPARLAAAARHFRNRVDASDGRRIRSILLVQSKNQANQLFFWVGINHLLQVPIRTSRNSSPLRIIRSDYYFWTGYCDPICERSIRHRSN